MHASDPIEISEGVIVPPAHARMRQQTGVLTADGAWVPQCETHRFENNLTKPAGMPDDVPDRLSGTWLWGGSLYDHFGHFLIESQARAWWAMELDEPLDGIVFVPKRPRHDGRLSGFQRATFDAWGIVERIELALKPTRVERLIVPPQAIALGDGIGGTSRMRSAARRHFAAGIGADGPERLYVSRSRLAPRFGSVAVEPALEDALGAAGYEVFHPQDHDVPTQIARYKAARQLVFCDGSALHLFAYLGREDQRVAILPRREVWTEGPVGHVRAFTGADPVLLPRPVSEIPVASDSATRGAKIAVHDLDAVRAALIAEGFIVEGDWPREASM